MDIGLKIKELVEVRNYNKTQLADELGMTENNLYKIFKKTSIDTELLEKISSLLGVKITYFFSDEVVEKNDTIDSRAEMEINKDLSYGYYNLVSFTLTKEDLMKLRNFKFTKFRVELEVSEHDVEVKEAGVERLNEIVNCALSLLKL